MAHNQMTNKSLASKIEQNSEQKLHERTKQTLYIRNIMHLIITKAINHNLLVLSHMVSTEVICLLNYT